MWLVVGLGNPGARYENTRHNAGQFVVDELALRRSERWREHKAGARVIETWLRAGGEKLVLAKPNTYMNVSGTPVAALAKYYDIAPENVIAVHDELDIPFDTLKLKLGGSPGGHNGVKDIIRALGTPDFHRVRVGVGRPSGRQDSADWVLSPFSTDERANLPVLVADAADAVELLIDSGLIAAQQKFHAPRA